MVYLRPLDVSDRIPVMDIMTSPGVNQTYMLPDFKEWADAFPLFIRLCNLSREKDTYIRAIATDEGLVGFLNHTDIQGRKIELGYAIHPNFQGSGYMTEALKLAITELFAMGYEEVTAGAFSTNAASIRVMEKCGMTRTDRTEEIEYRGQRHTCVYYKRSQE